MDTTPPSQTNKRVVILGGGFGGLACCNHLKGTPCEILLIDKQNHHLFQPLLYQVATAGLSAPEIAQPLRSILAKRKNVRVVMGEVTQIDLEGKKITTSNQNTYTYDYLVIALGMRTSYFGNDTWAQHALGLKTADEAMAIRTQILHAFEKAESSSDPQEIVQLLTIIIIGGGPTGVELAGALAELAKHVLKEDFRKIDPSKTRIILIEFSEGLVNSFSQDLQRYAKEKLEAMGVEVWTKTHAQEIGENYVVTNTGKTLHAANILWACGLEGHPVIKHLNIELKRAGRISVEKDLSLPNYPHVFAIGDCASVLDKNGGEIPGVAPAAMQMGQHVGTLLAREIQGHCSPQNRPSFVYKNKGMMATIGRSAAIAEKGRFAQKGFLAWLTWLFVHLFFLIGLKNKVAVLLQWFYSYIRYKNGSRIITGLRDRLKSPRVEKLSR